MCFLTEGTEHPPTLVLLFTSQRWVWAAGTAPCNGRGTVPSSWPSWLSLVTPGTPCSVCTTQHRPFLSKVKVSGLGWLIFFFPSLPLPPFYFLRCQPSHGRITQKSRRDGKPIQHIINGRTRSAQALGQSPCLAPHSKGRARLSNDLTAISDPDIAPALFPTLWFLVAEV